MQHEAIGRLLNRLRNHARFQLDAILVHGRHQLGAQHRIEAAQDTLLADDELHIGAQGIENTCELNGDIAAAGDQHTLWPVFQLEEPVRRYAKFGARDLRDDRSATCRNNDTIGIVGSAVHIHVCAHRQNGPSRRYS